MESKLGIVWGREMDCLVNAGIVTAKPDCTNFQRALVVTRHRRHFRVHAKLTLDYPTSKDPASAAVVSNLKERN